MSNLVIAFSHDFKSSTGSESTDGPQFHRYLPSRTDGSLTIAIPRPQGLLRMWFERRGAAGADGWVTQDYKGASIELERVRRQAVLEGGPFFGSFTVEGASADLLAELRLKKFGAPLGLAFAEQLVRAVINPHFVRTVASIRHLLGQYWLKPLYPWVGSLDSLGTFCQHIQMRWKTETDDWQVFCPVLPMHTSVDAGDENPYVQLPDERRWLEIVSAIEHGYEPSLASQALVRAHALKERGDVRLAYVEATTALEVAVSETVRDALLGSRELAIASQSFHGISFAARLAIVAAFRSIPPGEIELCVRGYARRNSIAHEGTIESSENVAELEALLRVGRALLPGPQVAYPRLQTANEQRKNNEEWEAQPAPKYRARISMASRPPGFSQWTDADSTPA